MQFIYTTDTAMGDNGLPLNNTPFAKYCALDLASILDLIVKGELPCGTGEDFPVDWPNSDSANTPWAQNGPTSSGPWKTY